MRKINVVAQKRNNVKEQEEGVAELPHKKNSKSHNFHKLRLFYVHKIL